MVSETLRRLPLLLLLRANVALREALVPAAAAGDAWRAFGAWEWRGAADDEGFRVWERRPPAPSRLEVALDERSAPAALPSAFEGGAPYRGLVVGVSHVAIAPDGADLAYTVAWAADGGLYALRCDGAGRPCELWLQDREGRERLLRSEPDERFRYEPQRPSSDGAAALLRVASRDGAEVLRLEGATCGVLAARVRSTCRSSALGTLQDGSLPLTINEWEEFGNPHEGAAHDIIASFSPLELAKSCDAPRSRRACSARAPRRAHGLAACADSAVYLHVAEGNDAAIALYRGRGFRDVAGAVAPDLSAALDAEVAGSDRVQRLMVLDSAAPDPPAVGDDQRLMVLDSAAPDPTAVGDDGARPETPATASATDAYLRSLSGTGVLRVAVDAWLAEDAAGGSTSGLASAGRASSSAGVAAALSAAESDAGELRREIRETKERLRCLREAEAAHARDEAIARTLFDFIGECEAAGVDIAPLKDVAALVADGPAANKTAH
ncbi:serine-type exopeptidase [Aureococcus anophagefferens]|uniref:Serine-type exopeptidase n=1 Tax=Aureococcus anophagefferens TaxID=44056 RepID=A0ABR1FIB1_AURAN